jgi:hypothetical protein
MRHVRAAASINIVRAWAPAVRSLSQASVTLLLVPVTWPPLSAFT